MRIVAGNSEAGLRTKGVNYEHYIDKHLLTRLNLFLLTICISLCKKLLFCVPLDISHLPDWKSTNLWNSFRVIVDGVSQLSVVVEDEPPSLPTFRGPSNLIGERLFKNIFFIFYNLDCSTNMTPFQATWNVWSKITLGILILSCQGCEVPLQIRRWKYTFERDLFSLRNDRAKASLNIS
jgi:hypothetical protein